MMGEMREMTLSEFLATLPEGHRARREFADLERERDAACDEAARMREVLRAIVKADESKRYDPAMYISRWNLAMDEARAALEPK